MVDMYGRYNINRVSLDSDAEDQCYQDIYIFLELLIHVMSKEVLDLSSDDGSDGKNFITPKYNYTILTMHLKLQKKKELLLEKLLGMFVLMVFK